MLRQAFVTLLQSWKVKTGISVPHYLRHLLSWGRSFSCYRKLNLTPDAISSARYCWFMAYSFEVYSWTWSASWQFSYLDCSSYTELRQLLCWAVSKNLRTRKGSTKQFDLHITAECSNAFPFLSVSLASFGFGWGFHSLMSPSSNSE